MANQEHLEILRQGVKSWNEWRWSLIPMSRMVPDLRNADLRKAELHGANLSEVYLSGANLSGANLVTASLDHSEVINANLTRANLTYATFRGTDLTGTDLTGANLRDTLLFYTNLNGTNLCEIRVGSTTFFGIDLRTVRGLDTLIHQLPSIVDIKTIQLPEGKTRTHFLRGAGFSDAFIDYLPSLLTATIQFASCFICYAHQDVSLAQRLYKDLQDKGVRCWFALEDLKIGDKLRPRIDEAIHLHEKLLLLLSKRPWQAPGSRMRSKLPALEKERRQQREVLFPVCLDESVMQATQAWAK